MGNNQNFLKHMNWILADFLLSKLFQHITPQKQLSSDKEKAKKHRLFSRGDSR